MRIGYRFKSLIAPRERQFLAFVGRARPDDADNGNERVNVLHVALATQASHGRTFNVMHRPRAAAGNHFPNRCILPRFKRLQIHADAAPRQRRFRVAHHRQAALREHVNFNQTNDFNGVHVEMRGGITLVGNEGRRQFVHRLAGQHHAARVHFGITRKAVEKFSHVQRGLERFFV